jgi:hypothetical protein
MKVWTIQPRHLRALNPYTPGMCNGVGVGVRERAHLTFPAYTQLIVSRDCILL